MAQMSADEEKDLLSFCPTFILHADKETAYE